MGKDRFKRILIIVFVAFLFLVGAKVFADWQGKKKAQGEVLSLPTAEIGEKISDFGEQVLGRAIEVLPGNSALKQKIILEKESSPEENQTATQGSAETEKVEKVEIKTQEIIEIIKELPAEQLENIKKQIFKDFCQKVLEE
ncbi:hypothetical protein MUP35_03615 [Patescibacteria group bacterium]|nr:hypothetical protein [Patescibacteria group bacterium]